MEEIMCPHCKENFKYDSNDVRPYIYHECQDGTMRGIKNPNLRPRRKKWTPIKSKPKKTIWQEFK